MSILIAVVIMALAIWYIEDEAWKIFSCGYILHIAEYETRKAWAGMEGHLTKVVSGWSDIHWGIWVVVALSAVGIAMWRMDVVRKRVNLLINGVQP